MKKYILAENENKYRGFVLTSNMSLQNCVYVKDRYTLAGIDNPDVEFVGDWHKRPDAWDIKVQIDFALRKFEGKFCDENYAGTDHHPDCQIGKVKEK